MDAHTVLCRARNLIDREGWRQDCNWGYPYRDGKGYCIHGALMASDENPWTATGEAVALLRSLTGGLLLVWNDQLDSVDELFEVVDRAISATAPEPDLNLNENGGRKDWNALEARVRV